MSLSSFPPVGGASKQNFYGFKYDLETGVLTIEEVLFGDASVTIMLPEVNDDGTPYKNNPNAYSTTALTPYELSFSWDTTNTDQLIMEVL